MGFVGGDLEDGIRRRVADRLAGADMLFPEPGDDVCSGCMAIAQNARDVAFAADGVHQFRGEGLALGREITPIEHHRRPGDFPMAGWRILAAGDLVGCAIKAEDPLRHRHPGWIVAAGKLCDFQKSER